MDANDCTSDARFLQETSHVSCSFLVLIPFGHVVCVIADDEVFIDIIGKTSSVQIQAIRVSNREKT